MSAVLLRYPADVNAELDKLMERMRDDAEFRAVRLSRAMLLRMAVFEGLDQLKKRYNVRAAGE